MTEFLNPTRLCGLGVAEPDRLAAFIPSRTHPCGGPAQRVAVVDDHGLDEQVLAGEEKLAAGLRAVIAAAAISLATCRTVSARILSQSRCSVMARSPSLSLARRLPEILS
jgi:hypothetical protein